MTIVAANQVASIHPEDEMSPTTGLPSISETISRRRNALFGLVARLSQLTRHSTAKSTYHMAG